MKNEYTLFENEPTMETELKDPQSSLLAARNQQMETMTEKDPIPAPVFQSDIPEMDENAPTYEKTEIFPDVTAYFHGDELAASVWIDKYALKNKEGKLVERTPDDMHRRLAREFARIERHYPNPMSEDQIFELLRDFRYIMGSRRRRVRRNRSTRTARTGRLRCVPTMPVR